MKRSNTLPLFETPRRWSAPALAAVLWLVALPAGGAALYQWTDAEGNVVFSDQPPPEPPPGGYRGPKPPTIGEWLEQVAEEERRAREEAARRARASAEEQAAEQAAILSEVDTGSAKKRIESRYTCEQARRLLAGLREPGREFYTTGEDGSFRRRTPEEIAERVAQWEEAEAILCDESVEVVPPGTPPTWPPPEDPAQAEGAAGEGASAAPAAQ